MYFATKITGKKIEETACFCRFRRIETGEKLVSLTSKVKKWYNIENSRAEGG